MNSNFSLFCGCAPMAAKLPPEALSVIEAPVTAKLLKLPAAKEQFRLKAVKDFRVFGCRRYGDLAVDEAGEMRV